MLKKFLAGLSTAVLALGMVVLTASPASAHHNTIDVDVVCHTDGTYKVTWSVTNSEHLGETIIESSDPDLVPVGTTLGNKATVTFVEYFDAPTSKTLTLKGKWDNNVTHTASKKLWANQFPDCAETITAGTPLFNVDCPPSGKVTGTYTIPSNTNVRYDVRINSGSWQQDVASGVYEAGLSTKVEIKAHARDGFKLTGTDSWTKWIKSTVDCRIEVTAPKPSYEEAVCTGAGTVGSAFFTIPSDEGIKWERVTLSGTTPLTPGETYEVTDGTLLTLVATALPGYKLTNGLAGVKTFIHLYDNLHADDCVEPTEPDFTPAVCNANDTGKTQSILVIESTPNVKYFTSTDGGDTWTPATLDTEIVVPYGTTITVKAKAAKGAHLVNYTGPWTFVSTDPGDCIDDAPVGPVTGTDQQCIVGQDGQGSYVSGAITIPNTPNVSYFIDGEAAAAGEHELEPGSYTVTAVAADGYQLVDYPDGGWTIVIDAAEPCGDLIVLPAVTPVVTFTQTTCDADGSFTLATEEEIPGSVIWTVNGESATEGTVKVTEPGTVKVTASPADGFGFAGEEGTLLEWEFEFTAAEACGDLDTLALTGGSILGGLGVAWVLVIAGGLAIAATRRREAEV